MEKKHKIKGNGLKTRLFAVAIMAALTLTVEAKIDKEIFAHGQEKVPGEGIVLPKFDISNDLLIAGYDNRVDLDDFHAHASFASIIRHPDYEDLNYFAVYGAYGIQRYVMKGEPINGCPEFFRDIFGKQYEQWIDADQEWDKAAKILKEKTGGDLRTDYYAWLADPDPNKEQFKLWHNDTCGPDYILGAGLDFSDTVEVLFILDEDELYDEYYERVENRNLMQDFLNRFVLYLPVD